MTTVIELNRGQKSRAARAIEGVHAAYYEADGIKALESTIAEKRSAAAKHVYALAVFATESEPSRPKAIALYLALCEHAEESYKAHHKVTDLSDALPTWKTFKSNILTGMRDYELDPREHRSEGAFRTAKAKAKESAAAPLAPPPVESGNVVTLRIPKGETLPPAKVGELLAAFVDNETLRDMLAELVYNVESLKQSRAADAEVLLRAAIVGMQPLVDKRRAA